MPHAVLFVTKISRSFKNTTLSLICWISNSAVTEFVAIRFRNFPVTQEFSYKIPCLPCADDMDLVYSGLACSLRMDLNLKPSELRVDACILHVPSGWRGSPGRKVGSTRSAVGVSMSWRVGEESKLCNWGRETSRFAGVLSSREILCANGCTPILMAGTCSLSWLDTECLRVILYRGLGFESLTLVTSTGLNLLMCTTIFLMSDQYFIIQFRYYARNLQFLRQGYEKFSW